MNKIVLASIFAAVIGLVLYAPVGIFAQENSLLDQLQYISENRTEKEFQSLCLLLFGYPDIISTHKGLDIWFYNDLSSSLIPKVLKNVYLLFDNGRIVDVNVVDSKLSPYKYFEVYP